MKSFFLLAGCLIMSQLNAQFHTLTMPESSPSSHLGLQVGVTQIDINYHSPSVRGRDVWNNPNIIPQNGDPIAWRAGANENTTIEFDTDVFIEGQPLKAGKYGFHILPKGHEHTLLFANPNNLWGSYYLDLDNDIALKVTVLDSMTNFSEHLQYAFYSRYQNSVIIALNWGDRQIPFTISVDLEKTCVEKFRYELNGNNTYRWQAWNDAAVWCLEHNTNLTEALEWVNRSINGGYGGFAAHRSFQNLSTKIELLDALGKTDELEDILAEISTMSFTVDDAHYMGATLLKIKQDEATLELMQKGLSLYENDFGLLFYSGIAYYYLDQPKKAIKALEQCVMHSPENFIPRLKKIQQEIQDKTFHFTNRKA